MNSSYRIFVWASVVILLFTLPTIGYMLVNQDEIRQKQGDRLIQFYNTRNQNQSYSNQKQN